MRSPTSSSRLEVVRDFASSPGPAPIWGLTVIYAFLFYGLAAASGSMWIALGSTIQLLMSFMGGWLLMRMSGRGPVSEWKADAARILFVWPFTLFFLESLVVVIWWIGHRMAWWGAWV